MPGNGRLTETVVSLAESLSQAARESAVNLSALLEKPLDGGEDKSGGGGMSMGRVGSERCAVCSNHDGGFAT